MKKKSYWLDERDIPNGRFGKDKPPDCECTHSYTCGACTQRCVDRNKADKEHQAKD